MYFIGSGFSCGAGAPLTKDILHNIKRRAKSLPPAHELNEIVTKIIKPFESLINNNQIDAESLLTALNNFSIARHVLQENNRSKLIRWRDDLKWTIIWEIGKSVENNPNKNLYDYFVKNLVDKNDAILSLNYDLIVENAFERTNVQYDPGYHFGNNQYGDFTQVAKFQFQNKSMPRLIKLHGSMNWLKCNGHVQGNGTVIDCPNNGNLWVFSKKVADTQYFAQHHFTKNLKHCDTCDSILDPVIIPPQLDKSDLIKNHYQILWNQAYLELIKADEITFIGCSLREADVDVCNLLRFAVNDPKARVSSINVIDPTMNTIDRFKRFFRPGKITVKPIKMDFIEYLRTMQSTN